MGGVILEDRPLCLPRLCSVVAMAEVPLSPPQLTGAKQWAGAPAGLHKAPHLLWLELLQTCSSWLVIFQPQFSSLPRNPRSHGCNKFLFTKISLCDSVFWD